MMMISKHTYMVALVATLLLLSLAHAENVTIDWVFNPASAPDPATPLEINLTTNVQEEEAHFLIFVYPPMHNVVRANSSADQLACIGEEICGLLDSPCTVPIVTTNNNSGVAEPETWWYFCHLHCPYQNAVINLLPLDGV